jgi:hypothetical protein
VSIDVLPLTNYIYAKLFQAFLSRPSICKMMLNDIGYIFRYCRIACDGIKKPVNEEPKRRLLSLKQVTSSNDCL